MKKFSKAYILYANDTYFEIVSKCIESIRTFSDLPIILYMLNSDLKCSIHDVITHKWECNIDDNESLDMYNITNKDSMFYINRSSQRIYKLLIQRPAITIHALENYADTIAYIDSDGVVTQYIDTIFNYYNPNSVYPYLTEGVYDFLFINDKGEATLEGSLEKSACDLFEANQHNRKCYRTSNMYVAGQNSIPCIKEWWAMCNHPTILADFEKYAPFHEETLINVLLWKYNYQEGLPYMYINGSIDIIDFVFNKYEFTGRHELLKDWVRIPALKELVLFIHGEKRLEILTEMIQQLTEQSNKKKPKIMFLAPHLSTGGMPAFLQKRIECIKEDAEIFVIEYACVSMDYTVQRNAILHLVGPLNFMTLRYENKMDLFNYIDHFDPDIIHIDEMSERLDRSMITRLYDLNRKYRIVETCHDVSFNPSDKMFIPDMFLFCTPYHLDTFKDIPSYKYLIEFPIDVNLYIDNDRNIARKKLKIGKGYHVLNVGLWTSGKNQAEGLEIARKYPDIHFHFVGNQAGNFQEYWEPLMKDIPKNVTIWGERHDVDLFYKACDVFMFNSIWECNPLVLREAISYGLPIIAHNLPQYKGMFDKFIQPIDADLYTLLGNTNYSIPLDNTSIIFGEKHLDIYTKLMSMPINRSMSFSSKVKITQHFVNNPFLEITGNSDSNFLVKFFDENDVCQYENIIKSNHWIKLHRCWYTKWTTKVWENGVLIYDNTLDYTGKRVLISFDSESLGDTIAWIPYALEFQKKHNCKVIVGTFKNFLFEKVYPELEFVEPGITVHNLYGMYKIGWFYNHDMEPVLPNTIPLQQTASNILGLEYKEILPRIDYTIRSSEHIFKYITIATNSTAACKFWVKEEWQKLVDYLLQQGYKVVNVSKEENFLNGVDQIKDTSLENTMRMINYSEFFIGLSSGLSWLAWAMKKHVVMISNFTEANHEFQSGCTRITNTEVCHGCWNNPNFKFDKGDYNWCPIYKGTPKQFECHKSISYQMVIDQIQKLTN